MFLRPSESAAASACLMSDSAWGLLGLTSNPNSEAAGTNSCSNPNCLATSKLDKKLTPVTFPPGQLRLATSPNCTGSAPIVNTIGMVEVAALASRAAANALAVAITLTRWPTSSAAYRGCLIDSSRVSSIRYGCSLMCAITAKSGKC